NFFLLPKFYKNLQVLPQFLLHKQLILIFLAVLPLSTSFLVLFLPLSTSFLVLFLPLSTSFLVLFLPLSTSFLVLFLPLSTSFLVLFLPLSTSFLVLLNQPLFYKKLFLLSQIDPHLPLFFSHCL